MYKMKIESMITKIENVCHKIFNSSKKLKIKEFIEIPFNSRIFCEMNEDKNLNDFGCRSRTLSRQPSITIQHKKQIALPSKAENKTTVPVKKQPGKKI